MRLDDLIDQVEDTSVSEEPLDLLSAAMDVKAEVDDLTDSLIGHFVDRARQAGCSWSEIGAAMGVTKQAAQQRHTGERPAKRGWRMGRFTPRARTAVREAQSAAVDLGHSWIGTEHLLLGLLASTQSVAAKVLAAHGITYDEVAEAVRAATEGGERRRRRHLPFTPLAKRALEGALTEAVGLGHGYVGTEHLLLSVRRVEEGLAAKVLAERGLTLDAIRAEVVKLLAAA